jgi:drug/metabolite transporter (DMT)-like permease
MSRGGEEGHAAPAPAPFVEASSASVRRMPRWEGVAVLFLTLGCWCAVPLFIRHLSAYVDHWTNNGWRYGASALFWLPAVLWALGRGRLPKAIWRAALVPALANTLAQVAFTAAHSHVNPGLLTFGLRAQLVAVAVGAYLLFPAERPTIRSPRYLAGLALLAGGIVGVVLGGEASLEGGTGTGVALAVSAGVGYAVYGLAVRRFMIGFHPVLAFGVIALYTGGALVAAMVAFAPGHGAAVLDLAPRELWAMGLSAFLGIALGHVLYYTAIDRLGVAVTSGVLQLQPFVVSAGSAALFGEALGAGQWAAGAVAVTGAGFVLSAQKAAERSPRRAGDSREGG